MQFYYDKFTCSLRLTTIYPIPIKLNMGYDYEETHILKAVHTQNLHSQSKVSLQYRYL